MIFRSDSSADWSSCRYSRRYMHATEVHSWFAFLGYLWNNLISHRANSMLTSQRFKEFGEVNVSPTRYRNSVVNASSRIRISSRFPRTENSRFSPHAETRVFIYVPFASPQVSIVERYQLWNSANLARCNLWNWQSKKLLLDLKFRRVERFANSAPSPRTLANIRSMQIGSPHGKRVRGRIPHTNYRKTISITRQA